MSYPIANLLNDLDPEQNIYRVFRLNRFFDLVKNKRLTLSKPYKWDDPFENILGNAIIEKSESESISFGLTNRFYGQCWTRKKECDGMWRNYASLNSGVIVQTTADKLLSAFYNEQNQYSEISYFLGNVIYCHDSKIIQLLSNRQFESWITDTTGKNPAKTLLIKREEFRYEEEVRLLYSDYERNHIEDDFVNFNIAAKDLFTELVFAPKITLYRYMAYREFLIKMGFDEKVIKQSKLYDPYKLRVKQKE